MKCSRCTPLMIYEKFFSRGGDSFFAHRCPMCGEITDDVIEANRIGHEFRRETLVKGDTAQEEVLIFQFDGGIGGYENHLSMPKM